MAQPEEPILTLDVLEEAVGGAAAAVRAVTRLQPAGGPGDKIFPPTYATGDRTLKYALETRRVGGQDVETVLLDSVASQANRFEQALLRRWEEAELPFPVIAVDFTDEEGIQDLDRITTLDAPHRVADALLRDSMDATGEIFRQTDIGRAYTTASTNNATAVYTACPTALVFGVWDSTGPRGGLGNKFQRALVSEIVGFGVHTGRKTASRIDPAGIQANVPVYHRASDPDDWTINEDEAQKKKGQPVPFSRRGSEGKGKPSAVNHSNVAPSIDEFAGGVTVDYAQQTTVLSLVALRRLRFQEGSDGTRFDAASRSASEAAARTALAALALAATSYARADGYDLRSRSFLLPEEGGPLTFEVVPAEGGQGTRYRLPVESADQLLREAAQQATAAGMRWEREPIGLRPTPKLADLIRRSRELASEQGVEEGA